MSYRYEIDENNVIRAWDDSNPNENDAPFLLQPDWPNGEPWANADEAKTWVEAMLNALENPESEFIAGDGPHEPLKKRPVPVIPEEPQA